MSNKVEYVRCPRCELNYITKNEKLCKVCEAELASKGNKEISDEEAKEMNICPVCKVNYLIDDEEICSECASEKLLYNDNLEMDTDSETDEADEKTENWRQYVENDDAEVPEDEFGEMTSIRTEDELDGLDGEEMDFDEEDEFGDEMPEEFEEEFADDADFAEDEDFDELDDEDFDDEYADDEDDFDDEDDE